MILFSNEPVFQKENHFQHENGLNPQGAYVES